MRLTFILEFFQKKIFSLKVLSLFILLFSSISCKTKKSNKAEDMLKSAILFKEAADVMMKGYKTNFKSAELKVKDSEANDSSKIYYEQALRMFQDAYSLDTSNIQLCIYLPNLYEFLGKHDSADYWTKKLPVDSIALSNKHSPALLPDSSLRK